MILPQSLKVLDVLFVVGCRLKGKGQVQGQAEGVTQLEDLEVIQLENEAPVAQLEAGTTSTHLQNPYWRGTAGESWRFL